MNESTVGDAIGKAMEKLPLYAALFTGEGSANEFKGESGMPNGTVSLYVKDADGVEAAAIAKRDKPDEAESKLAEAFLAHYHKEADGIQKDRVHYHFDALCWENLMLQADKLRVEFELP